MKLNEIASSMKGSSNKQSLYERFEASEFGVDRLNGGTNISLKKCI